MNDLFTSLILLNCYVFENKSGFVESQTKGMPNPLRTFNGEINV